MKTKFIYSAVILAFLISGCSNDRSDNLTKSPSQDEAKVMKAKKTLLAFAETQNSFPMFSKDPTAMSAKSNVLGKKSSKNAGLASNADFSYNHMLVDMATGNADYACGPTAIDYYIGDIIGDWGENEFNAYFSFSDLIWYYYFLIENTESSNETFGIDGEYTNVTNRTFKSLKSFWDIPNDIIIFGAHGSFFDDTDKVEEILELYRYYHWIDPATTDDEIKDLAEAIQTVFGSDEFWNFEHPLLSFNAFAASADEFFTDIALKIVMGDGIQDAYVALGYGDVATQAILAHEYGHHIQFANDIEFEFTPEGTRETELMADALSAYYLTHKRGATMNWKRVQSFLQVYFLIGDCQFDNPNHHGTPDQRMRAAKFGYDVATDTKKKGKILESEDFIELFYDAMEDIIED